MFLAVVRRVLTSAVLFAILASQISAARATLEDRRPSGDPIPSRETFSVTYTVLVDARDPQLLSVHWDLSGIQEISRLRFKLPGDRYRGFSGTGSIARKGNEVVWSPGSPYAHLDYKVAVNHRRAPGKGFDSYATSRWIVTRTDDLFPDVAVTFRIDLEPQPEARARLLFKLPDNWVALTPLPSEANGGSFVVEMENKRFDRPWGWLLLGQVAARTMTLDGCKVILGTVPGSRLDRKRTLRLLREALPQMGRLLGGLPPRILIISAPDPTWRGGISGEASLLLHGDRPLRTPDKTSPVLHELFHVLASFTPADDGHWITEGLAEYYSLEIQRRLGKISRKSFAKGIERFRRYGRWNADLTKADDLIATNNSAPLVMYAIDRSLRASSNGTHSLDDAVAYLSKHGGRIATADFLRAVNKYSNKNMAEFFTRHVFRGKPPPVYKPVALAETPGKEK